MWKPTFNERLIDWVALRTPHQAEPIDEFLLRVNQWWHQTPWAPYYLHPHDFDEWPNPWDLLSDNVFCSSARALGIMYTLILCDKRGSFPEPVMFVTDDTAIVQVGDYVLNMEPDNILNIKLPTEQPIRIITHSELSDRI